MKKLVAILIALLVGCTQPDQAKRVLESAGYKDIVLGDSGSFACSKDEPFRTTFRATGLNGQPVEGVVCGNMAGASTIRLY